jgi:hypothetical protein
MRDTVDMCTYLCNREASDRSSPYRERVRKVLAEMNIVPRRIR